MQGADVVTRGANTFLQFGAILGFVATAIVVINFTRNLFNKTVRGGVREHWVLFTLISLIPLVLLLLAFVYLSQRLTLLT